MADERDEERTEPATPRKREESRRRGHVARSVDLSSAAVLLAAVLALEAFGGFFARGVAGAVAGVLGNLAGIDGDRENLLMHFGAAFAGAGLGLLPLVAAVVAAALAVGLAQTGFLFTTAPIAPNLERLDPVAGLGRIFSLRGAARLASGLLKVAVVGTVVALTLWSERIGLLELGRRPFEEVVGAGTALMLRLALRGALALLVLGLLEYGYQRWQYERDLRMSKQELREEMKRYEGDPRIRERRRAVQRQLALGRMMDQVPQATVVVTNPTHLAVALRYDAKAMDAPVVVAKGADHLAARIREAAAEHGVPLVERKELARALFRSVDVGQALPAELYQAVAEILAYVYRLKGGSPAAAA
jgi:flagellar biosynthetic protein FlhB